MLEPDIPDEAQRRRREQRELADDPHVDGLTRGTVIEYDDWQWAVVTELALDRETPRVGFVLVDNLGDAVVQRLESAWGCLEHYDAVAEFRDTKHELWTDLVNVQTDDIWTVLGPVHPNARKEDTDE